MLEKLSIIVLLEHALNPATVLVTMFVNLFLGA